MTLNMFWSKVGKDAGQGRSGTFPVSADKSLDRHKPVNLWPPHLQQGFPVDPEVAASVEKL